MQRLIYIKPTCRARAWGSGGNTVGILEQCNSSRLRSNKLALRWTASSASSRRRFSALLFSMLIHLQGWRLCETVHKTPRAAGISQLAETQQGARGERKKEKKRSAIYCKGTRWKIQSSGAEQPVPCKWSNSICEPIPLPAIPPVINCI